MHATYGVIFLWVVTRCYGRGWPIGSRGLGAGVLIGLGLTCDPDCAVACSDVVCMWS